MRVMRIDERAVMPTRGSKEAAGRDLYAVCDRPVAIRPQETEVIHTGLVFEVPQGHFAGIYARSGMATNRGLRPSNCVGVVDPDYRGEVLVALYNDSDETQIVCNGDRVAQVIVTKVYDVPFDEVYEVSRTERGAGGFGSTGVK